MGSRPRPPATRTSSRWPSRQLRSTHRSDHSSLVASSQLGRARAYITTINQSRDTQENAIMTRRYTALSLLMLLTLASTPLAAQTTAGDLIWQPGGAVPSGPLTYIDFTRPVTMDGTVTHVTFAWISNG